MKHFKLGGGYLVLSQKSCGKSCSPSDWERGGKCDENGCYYEGDLPAYSLSPEMKDWCRKNPKDSYPESDFRVEKHCINSLVCNYEDKCIGCREVAVPNAEMA